MIDALSSSLLSTPLYTSPAMRAIMCDEARLQRMLDFEAALARAEAVVGVIPAATAAVIAEACQAELYDITGLVAASAPFGNIANAMVEALTKEVTARDRTAANYVHWGAINQDVIDTALVLELRLAIDALVLDLDAAVKGFTALAGRHRRTLAVARTMMQHALPMQYGLKLAGYAAALARSRERLVRLRREALALQFGGAAGTLAALGEHGVAVSQRLATLLDLPLPDAPWHSHRDRLAEVATSFAILSGSCGKIARDVALMMQIEVGEAAVPGGDDSSTLPHKRNPVGAAAALSAATVAPNLVATLLAAQVQEHERALGGWQTEWMTFPTLAMVTSGAVHAIVEIAEGLEIDVDRARANLDLSGGRIMAEAVSFALVEKIGRPQAHELMRELSRQADRENRTLKEVMLTDPRIKALLGSLEVEKLFIPITYQGSSQTFIDRLVVGTTMRSARRPETRQPEQRTPEIRQPESRAVGPPPADIPKVAAPAAEPPPPEPAEPRLPVAPQLPVLEQSEPAVAAAPAEALPRVEPAGGPEPSLIETAEVVAAADEATPAAELTAASAETAEPATSLPTPEPPPTVPVAEPPQPDEEAPGALMEVLSRADAEAQAAALDQAKR